MPKYLHDIGDTLFEEDVKKMYNICRDDNEAVLLSLAWLTGGRTQEILQVKGTDVIISEDKVGITLKTLKLIRKGQGDFAVPNRTLEFERSKGTDMNVYLETIVKFVNQMVDKTQYVVKSCEADRPASASKYAQLVIARVGQRALGKQITFNHFRHSVMTWLAKNGATVDRLKHFKGAKSAQSVMMYLNAVPFVISQENLRRNREQPSTNSQTQEVPQTNVEEKKESI